MPSVELSSGSIGPRSVWLVLFSPTGAFASVRARPRPWLTLLFTTLMAALPALAFTRAVDMQDFMLAELKESGRLEEMPEEALLFVKNTLAPAMVFIVPAAAALKRALAILLVAVLGFAFLRALSKELSFGACLAAVALGAAPLLLSDLLSALLFVVREARELDVRNPVLSNPAAWLSLHVEKDPLGALLHGLDVFKLWAAWLSAYGLNVVSGRRSAIPYALTFGGQALVTLAAAAGALASSL